MPAELQNRLFCASSAYSLGPLPPEIHRRSKNQYNLPVDGPEEDIQKDRGHTSRRVASTIYIWNWSPLLSQWVSSIPATLDPIGDGACSRTRKQIVPHPLRPNWSAKLQTASFKMPTSKTIGFAKKGNVTRSCIYAVPLRRRWMSFHLLKIICSRKV